MTIISLMVFFAPALAGTLIVHLFWTERGAIPMLFKICLGAGFGLGINSVFYFVGLLSAMNQQSILAAQILILFLIIIGIILKEIKGGQHPPKLPALSRLQWMLSGVTLLALVLSGLIFLNLSVARPQGARDAWSIWNRAARFIYRDPENWSATASPDLYWATHPDYPLLIPLNVAWGWRIVKTETQRIPQMQSAFFIFASIGLMFASVSWMRSTGQASLASLILMGTPILLEAGYAQISDVPLSFFILATCLLMYFYFKSERRSFLMLSGIAAGLGAWTKNEGLLFVLTSFMGLLLAGRKSASRGILVYLAGLAIPISLVLYFKLAFAPSNDIFALGENGIAARITDLSRYWQILKALFWELSNYGGWPVNIFIQLAIYALIIEPDVTPSSHRGTLVVAAVILFQMLGYCAIYVLTPHDLAWHLNFSFARLIFHVYPAGIFLYFCNINEPEKIFGKVRERPAAN